MTGQPDRDAYSPAEVAQRIGVTERFVHALIASGDLPSLKLGRRRLIRREALDAFLEALEADEGAQDSQQPAGGMYVYLKSLQARLDALEAHVGVKEAS